MANVFWGEATNPLKGLILCMMQRVITIICLYLTVPSPEKEGIRFVCYTLEHLGKG